MSNLKVEAPVSAVVLYDGECNLCNHSVQFILRRDPAERFRFAALQSPAARRLLLQAGQAPTLLPDSVILVEQGKVYAKSTAALRIARQLSGLWPCAAVLLLVPVPLRNWGYDLIARNRYRLFGRKDACMVPSLELQGRFLND